MRSKVSLALLLLLSGVAGQSQNLASPYSNSVFPAQIFSTTKTGTPIQLNGLIVPSTVGSSFASGSITLTGTSLTTVTFAIQGSSDNGTTYYSLPIFTVATPTVTPTTTITATANGLYQVNLAGLTHVRFVTSGTFTATSINLVLTASPNAMVSRSNGGTGSGVTIDGQAGAFVFGGPGVSHTGTTYTFNAGSGGTPPAGSIQDNQFNAGGGALGADTGIYQYDSATHTLKTRNLLPDAASFFTGLGNTTPAGKNNDVPGVICGNIVDQGVPCTTSTNQFYFQSKRAPSGGSNIIPRHLDVEIQGGFENENNPGSPEFEAERLTYHVQSSGQNGGVYAHFLEQDSPGDLVYKTLLMQCVGGNRSEDESCEHGREFIGFLNPNFGGNVVKGTTFSTGDQPVQITPFGGYSTKSPGIDMLLVDATKRVSAGNVINTTSVDSGWLVQVALDTPHSLGVSTKTTLTAAVDANVYTGSCPSVTNTGVLYPTTGPYAHSGDAFSTLENGTGLGTINANYRNDTTNTLIGYCLRFNAVGTAPPVGAIMHIADTQATSEFVTVMTSGTNFATAFVHHQHPIGAIVTWGGGVGQGFGMAADEIAPGSISAGFNFFTEAPQTSISKLLYPVAYTPDSTHVVIDTGAETSGAEWRTRGFPSVTPILPATVTLAQSGGVVNFASIGLNDYGPSPQFSGTSNELPPPAYTVAGCTVPPVLKFNFARVTGLSYGVSVVSGGSGCSGTPTVTLLTPPNPAYFAPVAWIRSVVDTNNCSTTYPFPCSSTDGYILADSGAKNFTNGDEILEGLRSFRYLTDQYNESGDAIVANSGRNGQTHLRTHAWVQSGSPYQAEVDRTPSEFIYGSFANGWTADPNIPRSAAWAPGPLLEIGGVQNTELDMLPPTVGGTVPGSFQGVLDSGQLNMGSYKFTFECALHPSQTGIVDHPCLHGQYFPFGLAFNKIGPHPSGIYVQPSDGTWHSTLGFTANGPLSGNLLTLPASFPDLPSPANLGLQNRNLYTIFSKSATPNAYSSDAQVSAGEYTGGLIHAGANNYSPSVGTSWGNTPIGSTTYSYAVTSVTGEGETTGAVTGASGGPASLDPVTNFIIIKGDFTGGAQGGNVYRTAGPGGVGFICSFTNGPGLPQCNDTGQAANTSRLPPSVDTSGSFQLANSQKMKSIQGIGTKIASFTGATTPNDIVTIDANGTPHDSGVPIGSSGGGGVGAGTAGQQPYYAMNGSTVNAITAALIVPPSGDATGATDGVKIANACASAGSVLLTAGTYHVGASNASITLSAPCKIQGQGNATVITNHGTTNDVFRISYFTPWSEGPWVYPASTNQAEISGFQIAQSGTPTAGYAFNIGSGVAPAGGVYSYTTNVHIHDTVMNGLWGGAKLIDSELYAFIDHNMWRQFVGGGAINYDACLGSGDNHISDNEFSGLTNSGIIIQCADTTMFAHDKLNGSGISFTGAAEAKTVQFTDLSVETGVNQPCAYDFGTGIAPTNVQINGGEQLGFAQLFCHPSNVSGFAFNLANSQSTSDYAAGLITNNGYAGPPPVGGGLGNAATPVFAPAAGTYASAQSVTITCATASPIFTIGAGAVTAFSTPISVAASETINSGCYGNGYNTTPTSAAYVITGSAQDLATFVGAANTVLSSYTTSAGKTFVQYSADGVTPQVMPVLSGSNSETLPTGSSGKFGDVLDTLTPSSANYTVSETFTLAASSDQVGIFGRASSVANTNYVFIYDGLGDVILFSQVAGTAVQVAMAPFTWSPGATHTLTLGMVGTSISCLVDGTPIAGSPFTNSAVSAVGQAGSRIFGGATGANFTIQ